MAKIVNNSNSSLMYNWFSWIKNKIFKNVFKIKGDLTLRVQFILFIFNFSRREPLYDSNLFHQNIHVIEFDYFIYQQYHEQYFQFNQFYFHRQIFHDFFF